MKIAFASCMSTTVFADQPVWDQIRARRPDHLVLTGDSIYIDTPPYAQHPSTMSDNDFAVHAHRRWLDLLAQPQWRALVGQPTLHAHAIWDDHDFLWNNAAGASVGGNPLHQGKARISRALFNAFRRALDQRLRNGSFPAAYNDASLWQPNEPAPGYHAVDLAADIVLHLTDGRSERDSATLLGPAQRQAIAARMAQSPDNAVHLLASGSVVEARAGESWLRCADDYGWLLRQAQQHKILVLSGDIHDNRFDELDAGAGRRLFDATSSGAAVRRLVNLGKARQNYGWIEIDATHVRIEFHAFGAADPACPAVRIDRGAWRLS